LRVDDNKGKEEFPEPVPEDAPGEETVGEILLAAREKAGMTLETASQQTRVPISTLQYLETDNFEALPARVYAKGFLRTYAELLGLDSGRILNRFEMQTGHTHKSRGDLWEIEEEVVEETLDSPRIMRRFLVPAAILLVLIVVMIRVLGGDDGDGRRPGTAAPPGSVAVDTAGTGEPAPAEREDGEDVREADPDNDGEPGDAAGAGTSAEADQDGEDGPGGGPPEPMVLAIRATPGDTTWFDLVMIDSEGGRRTEKDFILYPGQVETVRATGSFLFRTIGNAGGFTLELDGKELPPVGGKGEVKRGVRITREGIADVRQPAR